MTFLLSKIALDLFLPPSGLLVLMVGGLLLMRWKRSAGRVLLFAGIALLYLLSIDPLSNMLLRPLERYAPPLRVVPAGYDAIVVLAGGASSVTWAGLATQPSPTSLERVVHGVRLARGATMLPLVITGGSGDPSRPGISEGEAMAEVAFSLGLPKRRVMTEKKSRNTLENARYVRNKLGGEKSIILVTSASHMKRATAMFERAEFDVLPAPCGYRSSELTISIRSFIPSASSLDDSSIALYEYAALLWYRVRGKL